MHINSRRLTQVIPKAHSLFEWKRDTSEPEMFLVEMFLVRTSDNRNHFLQVAEATEVIRQVKMHQFRNEPLEGGLHFSCPASSWSSCEKEEEGGCVTWFSNSVQRMEAQQQESIAAARLWDRRPLYNQWNYSWRQDCVSLMDD